MYGFHGCTDEGDAPPEPTPMGVNRFSADEAAWIHAHMAEAGNGVLRALRGAAGLGAGETRRRLAPMLARGEDAYRWSITERSRNVVLN